MLKISDFLESLRKKVLDLSGGNPLLNFKTKQKSVIRIIDEVPSVLLKKLVAGDELEVIGLPVPKSNQMEKGNERPQEENFARLIGLEPNFELPESTQKPSSKHLDNKIQTLFYPEDVEARLQKIHKAYLEDMNEKGSNFLHLVFGFVEMFESDTSEISKFAPLLLLPVSIRKDKPDRLKGGTYRFFLESADEEVSLNETLQEYLRKEFGFGLPELQFKDDTEINLQQYFNEVREWISKRQPRWKLLNQVALCRLNYLKILIYKDLDSKSWPKKFGLDSHPVVNEILMGTEKDGENTVFAKDYEIDNISQLPATVYDADSSQHSAIIDVKKGKNLVIQGPPGTGKSQTITNIIASAISSGKSVLFVAEKNAALTVVKERLDKVGLGDFCLELHSSGTKKQAVIDSIRKRVIHSRVSPNSLIGLEERHKRNKNKLNEYINHITQGLDSFDCSIHDLIAKACISREKFRSVGLSPEKVLEIPIPESIIFSEASINHFLNRLGPLVEKTQRMRTSYGNSFEGNPWVFVEKKISTSKLIKFFGVAFRISSSFSNIDEPFILLVSASKFAPKLNKNFFTEAAQELWAEFERLNINEIRQLVKLISNSNDELLKVHQESIKRLSNISDVNSGLEMLRGLKTNSLKFSADTIENISIYANQLKKILPIIESLENVIIPQLKRFGLHQFEFSDKTLDLLQTLQIISSIEKKYSNEILINGIRFPEYFKQGIASLKEIYKNIQKIKNITSIERVFETEVKKAMIHVKVAYGRKWFQRLILPKGISARKWIKEIKLNKSNNGKEIYPWEFKYFVEKWEDLDSNQNFTTVFGNPVEIFKFPELHELLIKDSKLEKILKDLNKWKDNGEVLREILNIKEDFRKLLERNGFSNFEEVLQLIKSEIINEISEEKSLTNILKSEINSIVEILQDPTIASFPRKISLERIAQDLYSFSQIANSHNEIAKLGRLGGLLFGKTSLELEIDLVNLRTLENLFEFREYYNDLPGKQDLKIEKVIEIFEKYLPELLKTSADSNLFLDQWRELGLISKGLLIKNPFEISERLDYALSKPHLLEEICNYYELVNEAIENEAGELVRYLLESWKNPEAFYEGLKFVCYHKAATSVLEKDSVLKTFTPEYHEKLILDFRKEDSDLNKLEASKIQEILYKRKYIFQDDNKLGARSQWRGYPVLENEFNKKMKHLPIRELLNRAGKTIQALKPCFMMSPLTIAQYLERGGLNFDLVVMDEASQLRPEDAIGAVARGSQVVIVGDTKQLPPSRHFERLNDEDDEDVEIVETVGHESILEMASSIFTPSRRLRWHYRSRHESLIAFSNKYFYDDELIVFPSPSKKGENLGISLKIIDEAIYGNGINVKEAEDIVREIQTFAKGPKDVSLGVVAMNIKQAEYIENLIQNVAKKDEFLMSLYLGEGRKESFFVKNLENVQGDERDVIFISNTYGKASNKNFYHRFGPINGKHGSRRLNVLYTRARKRVRIFSSFGPDQLSGAESEGAQILKRYLEYAKTGYLETKIVDTGVGTTNDFEESVKRAIERLGFKVIPQLGVGGYFIDLAVVHPDRSDRYLMGIECDGKSYHSAKSARDRDRLRQQNLENLGWKIFRVWSTDWFKNEKIVTERLKAELNRAKLESPHENIFPTASTPTKPDSKSFDREALRNDLLNYREGIIVPEEPGVNRNEGILRKSCLELIITKPPTEEKDLKNLLKEAGLNFHQCHLKYCKGIIEIIKRYI